MAGLSSLKHNGLLMFQGFAIRPEIGVGHPHREPGNSYMLLQVYCLIDVFQPCGLAPVRI
jgi:hypothetical protein